MIIILHKDDKVIEVKHVKCNEVNSLSEYVKQNLNTVFFEIAEVYRNENIIWCHHSIEKDVNFNKINASLLSNIEMLSYHPSETSVFHDILDYTNFFSSTINSIPTNVKFQTWIMSEIIGIVNSKVINKFRGMKDKYTFQMTLNIMSQLGSDKGLLHYSEPNLYTGKNIPIKQISYKDTLKFIKIYQKRKWLLYIGVLQILNKSLKLFPLLSILSSKTDKIDVDDFSDLYKELNTEKIQNDDTIDVLIPTLGRKKYLKDVLDDLSKQSCIPLNVIIIEQHPDNKIESELDYIYNQEWPFNIKHKYIHQLGACNARNIGLNLIESKWVFMADDDIRLEKNTILDTLNFMLNINVSSVSIGTYLPSQDKEKLGVQAHIWSSFASGASIVESKYAKLVDFNMAYEFGYGEDTAYGNDLRKQGCATIYTPRNSLLHLKAPIGGFRFKFPHPWLDDDIQPKPSPTIMYYYTSYMTANQLYAYKVFLFVKQAIQNKKINLFSFKKMFNLQWEKSQYWAKQYNRKTI